MSGTELSVTHVDSTPPAVTSLGGVTTAAAVPGTMENPFTTLDSASGSTADVVFVHGGVYDGQNLVITRNGQIVSANGAGLALSGDQGVFSILGSGSVVVQNSSGNAFTVNADDVTVSGFTIDGVGTTTNGVYANSVTGLVVSGNTFADLAFAAISLDGSN
ncbi:unnamed protein product, partial [Ectocarpus sp. 4 AP-2014]